MTPLSFQPRERVINNRKPSTDSIETANYRWLRFKLANRTVSCSEVKPGKYGGKMMLGKVQVLGVLEPVQEVSVNGKKTLFNYDKPRSVSFPDFLSLSLAFASSGNLFNGKISFSF